MEPPCLRVPRRPPPLCSEIIRHATQDNAASYFSLLPKELCAVIDAQARSVPWLLGGVMRPLSLPHGLRSLCRLLSAEDEEVIVGCKATSRVRRRSRCLCLCLHSNLQRFITRLRTSFVSRALRQTRDAMSPFGVLLWRCTVRPLLPLVALAQPCECSLNADDPPNAPLLVIKVRRQNTKTFKVFGLNGELVWACPHEQGALYTAP